MNTLSSEIQLSSVSFFGRTLAEYTQFFQLDLPALRGRSVLDVAAGPSSFTAEACRLGIGATAVDPLYGCTPDTLEAHVQIDYARMFAQMREKPHLVRFRTFASIDVAEVDRRAAAARFLEDYKAHFVHDRYVGASLPALPFADGQFDLVLCAHLLFTYARLFDLAWHLAACRELMRVSRGEVRLHPVCALDGKIYPQMDALRAGLAGGGIASELVEVDYEFFAGATQTLVLRRQTA